MNPNDSELESQLRALRPRSPSPTLERNIAAEMASASAPVEDRAPASAILRRGPATRVPGWFSGLSWAFAGAVVALAAVTLAEHFSAKPATQAAIGNEVRAEVAEFEHAGSTEQLVTATDEGVVIDEDEPVRQVHYYTLERHVWINPQTGARMEVEIPREDVRFTPVAMQ